MHNAFLSVRAPRAFTLIELLVVIAIIGLLASVILASLAQSHQKASTASQDLAVVQYQNALDLYYADHEGFPYPGNSNATCLGTYPGGTCGLASAPTTENPAITAALDPYISGTPPGPSVPLSTGDTWVGFVYFCTKYQAPYCTAARITWIKQQADAACPRGAASTTGPYAGTTICKLAL
jgi:prepilin-type N-terminal cleavage/methylation domain-containing protein